MGRHSAPRRKRTGLWWIGAACVAVALVVAASWWSNRSADPAATASPGGTVTQASPSVGTSTSTTPGDAGSGATQNPSDPAPSTPAAIPQTLTSKVTVLVDASSVTAAKGGNGAGLITQQAALVSMLDSLTDQSTLTVYTFPGGGGPLRQVVSHALGGKEGEERGRDVITADVQALKASSSGNRPVHEATAAGWAAANKTFQPSVKNVMVVFTGGAEMPATGMDRATMNNAIIAASSPDRDLAIAVVAVGPSPDLAAAQQIASMAGGRAYSFDSADSAATVGRQVVADALTAP